MKNIHDFAKELDDAYSTERYEGGWVDCIEMLRERGYNDEEVEAIIRSKWTRWAADMGEKEYGEATRDDLARFLDSEGDPVVLKHQVKMLVNNLI